MLVYQPTLRNKIIPTSGEVLLTVRAPSGSAADAVTGLEYCMSRCSQMLLRPTNGYEVLCKCKPFTSCLAR